MLWKRGPVEMEEQKKPGRSEGDKRPVSFVDWVHSDWLGSHTLGLVLVSERRHWYPWRDWRYLSKPEVACCI